jgi:hypothetical protein
MTRRTLLAALAGLTACRREVSLQLCQPEQYGLEAWTVHPEQLDGAVSKANAILDPAGHLRLVTATVKPLSGQKSIPVSLVHGTFVSDADVAIIADGSCIFVNRDWKSQLAPFFGKDTTGTMDLEPDDALAIILLHEVGHIQPAALPDNQAISALVSSLGSGKQEEMRADAFAAGQIAGATSRKWDPTQAAFHVSLALSHISWNLQADRMLNNFGATSLNLPSAFNEKGLSHPNLELRFLVINYLVHPDKASLDLLNAFIYARDHPGGVLYQRDTSDPYSLFGPPK